METPKVRIYETKYRKSDGKMYGSTVAARDWAEAQQEADNRGIGEKIIGELAAIVEKTPDGLMTWNGTVDDDEAQQARPGEGWVMSEAKAVLIVSLELLTPSVAFGSEYEINGRRWIVQHVDPVKYKVTLHEIRKSPR